MSSTVYGWVSPGYERVREVFSRHCRDGVSDKAQLAAYCRGALVVDLWCRPPAPAGNAPEGEDDVYSPSHVQNVFSCSKVLTSVVVALLADRGHLRYDQLVTDLWPEYGQHGKEKTTVSMVMRHEAGLHQFDSPMCAVDLTTERVRSGSVTEVIAAQRPCHTPGEKRKYHALSRGWIVNEIVRRADPQGRTVGEILEQEITVPLNLGDQLRMGLPEYMCNGQKVAPLNGELMTESGRRWVCGQLLRPRALGGGKVPVYPPNPWLMRCGLICSTICSTLGVTTLLGKLRRPPPPQLVLSAEGEGARLKEGNDGLVGLFNAPEVRRCQIPSANCHASARALAKVAAVMVEGGSLGPGPRLLSEEGTRKSQGDTVQKKLGGVLDTWFGNAGFNDFKHVREGFVGWMGYGGSVIQWHQKERLAVGYTVNLLETTLCNSRGYELQVELLRAARQPKKID
mmetsp:Transcript_29791/g.79191  ORF Transcript_29791/g.79191 Transcript_29791/m.79191 type:complete len:454 (-) Transcript_29791:150-1511(-)